MKDLKTERIISEGTARRVILAKDSVGRRHTVRVIDTEIMAGPDVVARASALGLVRGIDLPSLASVEGCSIVGKRIEVTEAYVDGFSVDEALSLSDHPVPVHVALALVLDLARGLAALHGVKERDGRPARLIHGRIGPRKVLITRGGETRLVGFEGLRGDPRLDTKGALDLLQLVLTSSASSPEGGELVSRLSRLAFDTSAQLRDALLHYLSRQDQNEIATRRARFVKKTLDAITRRAEEPSEAELTVGGNDRKRGGQRTSPKRRTYDDLGKTEPPSEQPLERISALHLSSHLDPTTRDARNDTPAPGRADIGVDGSNDQEDRRSSLEMLVVEVDADEATATVVQAFQSEPDRIIEQPTQPLDEARARQATGSARPRNAPAVLPTTDPSSSGAGRRSGLSSEHSASAHPAPADSAQAHSAPKIGPYTVVASIGRGGMGEIYLAKHETRPGFVALKLLSAMDEADDEALGMLMDEAAIMARIDHPNVLRVMDFGRAPEGHYLATEYLEGRPLVRVMIDAYRRPAGMDYATIAAIGADAALGLFAAHTAVSERGEPLEVVHRDVSPQNIFVTHEGLTKVLDFGVARASERVSKTAVGIVKGKAAYMSPEQAEGTRVDARSDLFSLGTCLWEMAAGRRLFKRDSEYETLLAVATSAIDSPSSVRGRPDAAFDAIVMSALERNRRKRVQTAKALADRLMDYCQRSGLSNRREGVRSLMVQLFGDVAKEERALIRKFEARGASDEDSRALHRVSGVAAKPGRGRELTLAAEPSGLLLLDRFGELVPASPAGAGDRDTASGLPKTRGPSGDLPAFDSDKELLDLVAGSANVLPGDFATDGRPTRLYVGDDDIEPIDSETPSPEITREDYSIVHEFSASTLEAVAEAEEADSGLPWPPSDAAAGLYEAAGLHEGGGLHEAAGISDAVVEVLGPRRRLGMAIAVGLLTVGAVTGLAVLVRTGAFTSADEGEVELSRPVDSEPARKGAQGVASRGTDQEGRSVGGAARARDAGEDAGAAVTGSQITGEGPAPSDASTTQRTPPRVTTSSTTMDKLLGAIKRHGLSHSVSGGRLLIADAKGGEVLLGRNARVESVSADGYRGYSVTSDEPMLASVAWIGQTGRRPWRARALSVNDCPAKLRITEDGFVIRYGKEELRLPPGGGPLLDVAVTVPEGVVKIELVELGLVFVAEGQKSPSPSCRTGWWGKRLSVRRLPPGTYTLRWTSPSGEATKAIEVTTTAARGGELVHADVPESD